MSDIELFNKLIELNLFTKAELYLVTTINGFNRKTLNDCVYCRYGIRDAEEIVTIYVV